MNFTYKINENIIYNIVSVYSLNNSLRFLSTNESDSSNKNNSKKQLNELFIYIAVLAAIIIIILGGYSLYRRFLEKNALREIEIENQNIFSVDNNSESSSSEKNNHPNSLNNKHMKHSPNFDSEIEDYNNNNNSFDYNHEQRMERIRKKYGNSVLIKVLINKQMKEVAYNSNFKEIYGDICTICVTNFLNKMIIYKTPCEHLFHIDCFTKYLKNIKKNSKITCPNCNQNLLINKKYINLRRKTQKLNIEKKNKNSESQNMFNSNNINNSIENKYKNNEINNKNAESEISIDDSSDYKNKNTVIIIKKRKRKEISDLNKPGYENNPTTGERNSKKIEVHETVVPDNSEKGKTNDPKINFEKVEKGSNNKDSIININNGNFQKMSKNNNLKNIYAEEVISFPQKEINSKSDFNDN